MLADSMRARAVFAEGRHAVAVPRFGFERRGAPVAAFLRFDEREIRRTTNIYRSHCVLCIDPTIGCLAGADRAGEDFARLIEATESLVRGAAAGPTVWLSEVCRA
jgi:pyruvate ferredoxin oxidoreductase gamma subunit/phenylglyoxylate dehydrogenase gamma subunit